MPVSRSFIAIELPDTIHEQLRKTILQLSPATRAVRWVAPENIHLTLKFLGDVDSSLIPKIQDALKREATRCPTFTFQVSGMGAFPNLRRPRVVWIGVQAPPEIARLVQAVENATVPLGFPTEERSFSPHLTLGRVSQHASPNEVAALGALLARTAVGVLGETTVDSITLFRSDLRPTGAVYSPLSHVKLADAA